MDWLSNLLKGNEIKPIFGQPFLNTSGFDDKHQGLYYKDDANITIRSVEKSVDLSVGVIENCSDSDSISTVLGISKVEFLKLIASNNSRINDILKFLYKNGDTFCLFCSIYIVTEEATINHTTEKIGIRPISKLLLGNHVILCIPLKEQLNMNEAKQNVMQLLTKKHDGHLPEYLMNEAAILIDYDEILKKQAFEMLDELNTWQFSDKVVSLFVEIPEQRTNYSYFNDSLAIATMLKLKKFIFLNEEKFLFYSNYQRGKKPLGWNERAEVADDLNSAIRKIYNMDFSTFPPPTPKILYNLCKVYEIEYYYTVNEFTLLPDVQKFLYHDLENVFNFVKALPFHKLENAWIIEANDENSKEIYSIYLARKTCILYTKNTKHLIIEFFNESIIWVFSEETKRENAKEPVLIHDGKIEFLLGMITPTNCNKQECKNRKLYLARCSCNTYKDAKAWICTKCKLLVLCGDNGFAYCDCGVHREESLFKKCFKCFQKKLESSAPQTPATPTAPPTPKVMTPTAETTPKYMIPLKKNFNILFIGQSGAGKSMLVNSIYNYLKYDFEEVSKAESVECILPCQFHLQTPDFKKIVFKAGPEDKNENFNDSGESVTQYPKVYSFKTEKYDCQVIDTPGLGDTRGAKQDEHNLNLIRNAIIEIKELHSICFVMPSNISKLTSNFEVHMRDLLSLFPKTALKNVFFFFTYANSTFFIIGDTRNTLEEFISTFKRRCTTFFKSSVTSKFYFQFFYSHSIKLGKKTLFLEFWSILPCETDFALIQILTITKISKNREKSGLQPIKKLWPRIVHMSKGYKMATIKKIYLTSNVEIFISVIFDPSKKMAISAALSYIMHRLIAYHVGIPKIYVFNP